MIPKEYFGEGKNIEFKREIPSNHEKFLKDIIAFANSSGGKCIIGIEDETGNVYGIGDNSPFKMSDAISNMISDACTPMIENDIYPQTIDGKTVLVVDVIPGKQRPYYLSKKGKERSAYIRFNGTSRPADAIMLKELELQGSNRSYDSIQEIGVDYDESKALELCEKMKEVSLTNCNTTEEKLTVKDVTIGKLEDMGLLCRNGKKLVPTHAFMLMTDNKAKYAKIQCALFKGMTRDIFIDKKEFGGTIYKQLEEAYQFVLRHINIGAEIKGLYRKDIYEMPVSSIREMIANAIIHRSYLNESKIQISMFDDRLEVVSPGGLYGSIDFEMMKSGRTSCRNSAIAEAFQYMNIVEAWGTGVPRILKSCAEYGLPEPVFEEFGDCIKVTMFRKQANKQTSEQADKQTNIYESIIKQFLEEHKEATTAELAKILKLSKVRVRAIIADIEEIEAVGKTNTRKYRLKQ